MKRTGAWPKPIDASVVPRYSQPVTFMRTPLYESARGLDVALVGVPFDLGHTNRAGQRHGPSAIREASRMIRLVNPSTGAAPFDLARCADVGDAPTNPTDLLGSVAAIEAFFAGIHADGARPVSAGGDHTITLPILRGIAREGPVAVIQFDAHTDTLDTLLGTKINHATPFRRAVEEGLIEPKRMVQIGLRGTRWSTDDLDYSHAVGMRTISMDDYDAMGPKAALREIRRVVGDWPLYVTFDIDALDPIFAIGTGSPEPGGLSMRDAQVLLRGLHGLDVIGGDVCEVSPPLDPTDQTAVSGANVLFELLCLTAQGVANRRDGKAATPKRKASRGRRSA